MRYQPLPLQPLSYNNPTVIQSYIIVPQFQIPFLPLASSSPNSDSANSLSGQQHGSDLPNFRACAMQSPPLLRAQLLIRAATLTVEQRRCSMETQVRAALDSGWRSARTGRRVTDGVPLLSPTIWAGREMSSPCASRLEIFVSAAAMLAGETQRLCCLMTRRKCARALPNGAAAAASKQCSRRPLAAASSDGGGGGWPLHVTKARYMYLPKNTMYSRQAGRQASKSGNQ